MRNKMFNVYTTIIQYTHILDNIRKYYIDPLAYTGLVPGGWAQDQKNVFQEFPKPNNCN